MVTIQWIAPFASCRYIILRDVIGSNVDIQYHPCFIKTFALGGVDMYF